MVMIFLTKNLGLLIRHFFHFFLQETNKDQPGKNTITVLEAHQQFSGSSLGQRTQGYIYIRFAVISFTKHQLMP